jgi:hypothetical protein
MRYGMSLFMLSVCIAAFGLRELDRHVYDLAAPLMVGYGKPHPFSDLAAIMQAGLCWRAGVDVFTTNSCMGGGEYNYAQFLLYAGYLPYRMADVNVAGVAVDVLLILSFAALPPCLSRGELALRCGAGVSCATLYAIEQANFDTVVFIMVVAGCVLMMRQTAKGWAGYGVFLLITACKFYPAALLALLLRESGKRFFLAFSLLAAVGLLYVWCFGVSLSQAFAGVPSGPPYGGIFGARDLPFGAILLIFAPVKHLNLNVDEFAIATGSVLVPVTYYAGPVALALAMMVRAMAVAGRYRPALLGLDTARQLFLLAGILVMLFCFLAAQNIIYRAIFLLLVLPGLWEMRRRWLCLLVVVLMNEPTARQVVNRLLRHSASLAWQNGADVWLWFGYELLWWYVMARLCELLAAFALPEIQRLWTALMAKPPVRRAVPKPAK